MGENKYFKRGTEPLLTPEQQRVVAGLGWIVVEEAERVAAAYPMGARFPDLVRPGEWALAEAAGMTGLAERRSFPSFVRLHVRSAMLDAVEGTSLPLSRQVGLQMHRHALRQQLLAVQEAKDAGKLDERDEAWVDGACQDVLTAAWDGRDAPVAETREGLAHDEPPMRLLDRGKGPPLTPEQQRVVAGLEWIVVEEAGRVAAAYPLSARLPDLLRPGERALEEVAKMTGFAERRSFPSFVRLHVRCAMLGAVEGTPLPLPMQADLQMERHALRQQLLVAQGAKRAGPFDQRDEAWMDGSCQDTLTAALDGLDVTLAETPEGVAHDARYMRFLQVMSSARAALAREAQDVLRLYFKKVRTVEEICAKYGSRDSLVRGWLGRALGRLRSGMLSPPGSSAVPPTNPPPPPSTRRK
jgi:hypothetical protein